MDFKLNIYSNKNNKLFAVVTNSGDKLVCNVFYKDKLGPVKLESYLFKQEESYIETINGIYYVFGLCKNCNFIISATNKVRRKIFKLGQRYFQNNNSSKILLERNKIINRMGNSETRTEFEKIFYAGYVSEFKKQNNIN